MAYPGLAHEEHKYLGKEICTGYTDVYGKWNTGFYCPQYGSKTAVFCCGTAVFKYCCTNQEPVDPSSGIILTGDDPTFDGEPGVSSAVFVRVPIVFGVVCGILAVVILLIVAGCYFCQCCFGYKKRREDGGGGGGGCSIPASLYRTSNSTTSNLLNLYSPGGLTANSLVTTPLDLDWALAHASTGPSSIASSYQSQQLYNPLQYSHGGTGLSPAVAAVLSQQRNGHGASPSSLMYPGGGVGGSTPSVISGTAQRPFPHPPSATTLAYSLLNSSTSTLASRPGSVPPPQPTVGPPQQGGLHRGNLPQQISTTASIVNSYLASLQQAQQYQPHPEPVQSQQQQQPPPPQPIERPRQPSPPPPYFQIAPASYQNNRNNHGSSRCYSNRTLAAVQSVLAGGAGGGGNTISGSCANDEDLTDFLLRNEDYLRRTLRLGPSTNNNARNNQNRSSTTTTRSNPMLTQRELIELLLRLTYAPPSSSSISSSIGNGGGMSVSRSESRAGSDSTTATNRSSVSSVKSAPTTTTSSTSIDRPNGNKFPPTKLTISEVDEDNEDHHHHLHEAKSKSTPGRTELELALSRISDSDSGIPSSTCSTTGSEASAVIGSIKVISRDISELKGKQHAVDDEGGGSDHLHHHRHSHSFPTLCDHHSNDEEDLGGKKLHQHLHLAAIHPETSTSTNGKDDDEPSERPRLHHRSGNAEEEDKSDEKVLTSLPIEPPRNPISEATQVVQ